MSTLEVLQSFLSHRNALLVAIGSSNSTGLMDKFDLSNVKPRLPYHVSFQIEVVHGEKTIGQTVIGEGPSTCVMSISCWKSLGSPKLVPYNTFLNAFDGRSFCPHGILPSFDIELAWKMVSVEAKIVDALLDYNLLLGKSWTYAMCAILSSFF